MARALASVPLEDTPDGGTLLRVVESGFEGLSGTRRTAAMLGNSKGWTQQLHNRLYTYLASAA